MKKAIAAVVTSVALGLAGQAQACTGQHLAVNGTSSADAGCIFNVDVHADWYAAGQDTAQDVADSIAASMAGVGSPGAVNVSYYGGEGEVDFQIPAGVGEVTITVDNSSTVGGNYYGTNYWTAGGPSATVTLDLNNGTFQVAPNGGGCAPPPPPAPPLNAAVPGPGIDPDDNKAAMNDLQMGNVPLNDHDGDDRANRTGKVE